MISASKGVTIGILIFILFVIALYVIVMFELFKKQSFIFSKYTPPTPPSPYFYPLGNVTPLSQEQINARNAAILASTGTAT